MKVYDPVRGMTIEENEAVATSLFKGKVYSFCSDACKSDFDKNQRFLSNQGALLVSRRMPE
jgi:YHS domain-containing protein